MKMTLGERIGVALSIMPFLVGGLVFVVTDWVAAIAAVIVGVILIGIAALWVVLSILAGELIESYVRDRRHNLKMTPGEEAVWWRSRE
jgi:hypothetical protein